MMSTVFLVLGTFIVAVNLYTSFFRKILHDWRHPGQPYRFASGIPLLGTVFLGIGWWLAPPGSLSGLFALFLILADTGGPLCFVLALVRGRSK